MSKASELANLIGNINAGGGDNFIINGGMTISQRGSSFTNPSSNAYCLDRYAIQWSSISPQFTVSQDNSTPDGEGFSKSLKIATSNTQSESGGAFMYQKVEGNNISNIMFGTPNAKRLVLSFYVKSSKTGTYSVGFHNNGFDRNLVSEYTISSANTWEKKTIRFVGDTSGTWTTDNTIGMGVYFHLANGDGGNTTSTLDTWQSGNFYLGSRNQVNLWDSSSATWFITGVSLEIGQNPTSFEHEPFERTLKKCERYYQNSYETVSGRYPGADTSSRNSVIVTSWNDGNAPFPVYKTEMRAAPTVVLRKRYGNTTGEVSSGGSGKSVSATDVTEKGISYLSVSSGAALVYTAYSYELKAEL